MSYGADIRDAYRQASLYVARILRPTSPPTCLWCNRLDSSCHQHANSRSFGHYGLSIVFARCRALEDTILSAAFTQATDFVELFVRELFDPNKRIMCAADSDQLIKLDLDGSSIAVLGILNQKHHKKGDDGSAGIDDKLPSVRELKERSARRPDYDGHDREREYPGSADSACCDLGKIGKKSIG